MQAKLKIILILLTTIAFTLPSLTPTTYGWNPPLEDLPGTESSYDLDENHLRFDIYTDKSIAGMQVGEDEDSIAFAIKLKPGGTNSFSVNKMELFDRYEVRFTIAGEYGNEIHFTLLFLSLGKREGVCILLYDWKIAEILYVEKIKSGEVYQSISGNIGFNLTNAKQHIPGFVTFIVKKQRLYDLGARGNIVSGIYAATRSLSFDREFDRELHENEQELKARYASYLNRDSLWILHDRCPASGSASWQLQGDIPDLPAGILLLSFPLIAIYAYLKRSGRKIYGPRI
ncbi:hypothetical protein H5T51_02070 [Candidatus Bathyarchaeota archaeon]|nr:hypothetical protein [Candidatus Bathyarchaeota archaeon]